MRKMFFVLVIVAVVMYGGGAMGELDWKGLEYRLDTLGMRQTRDAQKEANVDVAHPLTMRVYIPADTKEIREAHLRFTLSNFLYYQTLDSAGAATVKTYGYTSLAGYVDTTGPGGTHVHSVSTTTDGNHGHALTSAGDHNHAGAVGDDGLHTHPLASDGDHSHSGSTDTEPDHTHQTSDFEQSADLPLHNHGLQFGINEVAIIPQGNEIIINGVDVTVALGGPFDASQDDLDITTHLRAIGWNTIVIQPTGPILAPPWTDGIGHIEADLYVELYAPSH